MEKYLEHMEKVYLAAHKQLPQKIARGIGIQLSMPQIHLLMFVHNKGSCIVTDIANHFDITLSAVTGLVDKLAGMGLVSRQRSGGDRRIVEISLTAEGKKVLDDIRANARKLYEASFSGLSDEDVQTYFRVVDRIVECILSDD